MTATTQHAPTCAIHYSDEEVGCTCGDGLREAISKLVARAEDEQDCGADYYDEPVVAVSALRAVLGERA